MKNDCEKEVLEIIHELVAELESIACKEQLNINVKIYDIDCERNCVLTYDIPQ